MHAKGRILVHSIVNAFEEMEIKADTIYPSYFVMFYNDAGNTEAKNNTVLGGAGAMVALENTLLGKTIDDSLTAGERVRVKVPFVGEKFLVTVVDSLEVTIGDILTPSATAGKVEAAIGGATLAGSPVLTGPASASGGTTTVQSAQMLLRAEEALGSATTADRKIIVRVLRA